ncbi:MAG: hypothetical protein ACYC6Y_29700, partial [Thermoguttaceae bacterium]
MRLRACFLSALLAATAVAAAEAECKVWVVTGTERVLRDARGGAETSAKLAAARNEWESFQILLRSDEPVSQIRVEAGDLAGPGGAALPASQATLYRQHQFELKAPTYRNDDPKLGWYPDALIPFRHPVTNQPLEGARLAAVPFDLPAKETHGFWVDLRVPKNTPPGEYRGIYRLTAAGQPLATVPVSLTVWDFELPDTHTLVTAL